MILDILYKLFRRSLPPGLYKLIRFSRLGRGRSYYTLSTYQAVFRHYLENGVAPRDKTVLELGGGNQFYTAAQFLAAGARRVILVDPVIHHTEQAFRAHAAECEHAMPGTSTRASPTNVQAFSQLSDVPATMDGCIDFICSHFVLEHFVDLREYFGNVRRLLTQSGLAYAFVDLSDHTYHVFDSRKVTKWIYRTNPIGHLRYSDGLFRHISDRRVFENRYLLPHYLRLSKDFGLSVRYAVQGTSPGARVHPSVLARSGAVAGALTDVTHFILTLAK